ncbi:MAG: lytic transglycosylase domain-containing protein [Defluviitaleaceae bacterium]|nr:lytic transglycosylase domain-containing protein [Defluviitaleaceae bacterium]
MFWKFNNSATQNFDGGLIGVAMKKKLAFASIVVLSLAAFVIAINMRFPVRYLEIVRENAGELEVSLILAVIMAESSFRADAESHAGAQGLMQLMPATAKELAEQMGLDFSAEDVWKPEINIAMGSFYLNRLKTRYSCIEVALAAYNAGQGNVSRWLADPEFSQDGQSLNYIPFSETRNYLQRVKRNQRIYNIILTVTGRANG